MTDNAQELNEILKKLARETTLADRSADSATTADALKDAGKRYQWSIVETKQQIIDWHNKQVIQELREAKRSSDAGWYATYRIAELEKENNNA